MAAESFEGLYTWNEDTTAWVEIIGDMNE